ncbi:hypothetical protein NHF50_07030 [Flavobacterium sp. NRK F10]|uniref:hypothetical protein n=1 Tax=Flavobacterium sp. NRK F10 TaxID=2954931 RepID=UPI0020915E83|nr:hypothetical protein [Flavobacterium sp. NRK F10]MCO6174795.1 hypothetical protein [Flavobacterium sp. NRK F10]
MKIKVATLYSALFSIILLAQLYIPSFKVNMLLQLIILAFFIFSDDASISIRFLKRIIPLFILFSIPFFVMFFYNYQTGNIIKDISYFIKPVVGITLGYMFFKKINNFQIFLKAIILSGLISASMHFVLLLFFTNVLSGSVSQIREFGKDNFLELFALLLLWFSDAFSQLPLFSKKRKRQILILLLISCFFYLSRTMFVVGIMMVLAVKGYTIITARTLKIMASLVLGILILYGYLFSVKINRNATGIDGFLYKLKIAPGEIFITKIDRENHKDLWDHWRAYEASRAIALMDDNPSSYFLGTGYGSQINLRFHSPLGGTKKD